MPAKLSLLQVCVSALRRATFRRSSNAAACVRWEAQPARRPASWPCPQGLCQRATDGACSPAQAPENNLGRSVSKASKARIRKALAHGAATLHAAAAKARTQRARVMERRPRA
jgi:hypothetical protein